MLDYNYNLSIKSQCELLEINRSTVYYTPVTVSSHEIEVMKHIDKIYLQYPFYGARRISWQLSQFGFNIGRKKVTSLMRHMGIEAIYQKPRTTITNKQHKKYPYLLRDLEIVSPNQVWSADITYIPMKKGYMYLVATIDWFSKYIVDYELSNSLDAEFCLTMLDRSLQKCQPKIFNTDQGVQFTCNDWINFLLKKEIKISMDGKGRAIDNIAIERFWKSLKYELIYLNPADSVSELKSMIDEYIIFYNQQRPHQTLSYQTPVSVYLSNEGYDA